MVRKILLLIVGIAILMGQSHLVNAAEVGFSVNPNQKYVASLTPCVTKADLDCLDSVAILGEGGAESAQSFLRYNAQATRKDSNGNTVDQGDSIYENVSINAQLETPKHVIFESLTGGALRLFVSPDLAHAKSKFKIAVRTSWLKPQDIQLKVLDAEYTKSAIPGGTLWTFSGIQTGMSAYNSASNAEYQKKLSSGAKADSTFKTFEIFVHHSDPAGSYFDTRCDAAGFTVESHNAPGAGKPFWNPVTKSLDFNIQAPHLTSSGALNLGFFKFWASDAYMDCAWPGNNLTTAKAILVSIIYEDGEAQVATSVIKHEDGQLVVGVDNLHFSSPTIRISAVGNDASAPVEKNPVVSLPSKKSSTINCVSLKNQKITKKVTAVKPLCPPGFKKK
jgi:hypothetical protein